MSWNILQKSLLSPSHNSRITSRLRRKRNRPFKQNENRDITILDGSDDDSCMQKTAYKRSKLDITITNLTQNTSSRTEGEIFYDEQTDNYCNGCFTQPSKSLNKIPLGLYTDNKQAKSPEKQSSNKRKPKNSPNINFIQNTFREFENDVKYLEKSIMDQSSDEEPTPKIELLEEDSETEAIIAQGKTSVEETFQISQASSDIQQQTTVDPQPNKDLNFLVSEIKKDLRSEKTLRCKKGGYLERLRKVLSSSESDYAFWQHEKRCGLINDGTIAEVKSISEYYGRKIVSLDVNNKEIYFFFEPGKKISNNINIGDKLDVEFNDKDIYIVRNKKFVLSILKILKKN